MKSEMARNETNSMNNVSLKKNTIFNLIKTLSTIVFPLITFPYISRVLHAENVGKINFSASIVSYFALFATLGLTTYAVRECSKVRSNTAELSKTASQLISISVVTTIISYIVLFLCLAFWSKLWNYQSLILIQSVSIICTSLGADWLNTAMEDFRYITIRTFIFQVIALIAMFVFVTKPEHYIIYAGISLISSSGGNIVNIFYRRKYCKVYFTFKMDWRKHIKPILLLFAMMLSQTINNNIDTTILGIIKGDLDVGLYSTANKIFNIANQVSASIIWVVMPQLSAGFANKNYKQVNKLLRYASGFLIDFNFPCMIGMLFLSKEILSIIAGSEYIAAPGCLQIFAIALLFTILTAIYTNMILLSSGREAQALIACIVSAVLNIITDIIFIPYFGINAAAATTAISQFVIYIISSRKKDSNISFGNVKSLLYGPIVGCIFEVILITIIKLLFKSSWIKIILSIFFSIFFYIIILIKTKNEFACETVLPFFEKLTLFSR
jgi:O-antigen/teichoic acid export membrane protein